METSIADETLKDTVGRAYSSLGVDDYAKWGLITRLLKDLGRTKFDEILGYVVRNKWRLGNPYTYFLARLLREKKDYRKLYRLQAMKEKILAANSWKNYEQDF